MNRLMTKLALAAVLAASTLAFPAPSSAVGSCPRDIFCADVWEPVVCSNGVTYSNACYAYRACATGCVAV